MTHAAVQVHEMRGNLLYTDHEDAPYWALRRAYQSVGGGVSNVPVDIDGEQWDVSLGYQESGLDPRPGDDVDQLYEYRVNANGGGRRELKLLIQPRLDWSDDERRPKSVPKDLGKGVNVRIETSTNIDLWEYPKLVPQVLSAVFAERGVSWNSDYFTGSKHSYSNITQLEVYVRLSREMAKKLVRSGGIFRRCFETCADLEGSKIVYSADNSEIVGYNHQLRFDQPAANRLFDAAPGRRRGFQAKHYHPKHVRSEGEDNDPLYHPKFGVLFKKHWNQEFSISDDDNSGNSVAWGARDELLQELEENLMNMLSWGDVPTKPGSWFVEDDHFTVEESSRDIAFFDDPTPEIERRQDSILIRTMRRLTDSDLDVLDELAVADGGMHVDDLEDATPWATSTIYRALSRLGELVDHDHGNVRFISEKLREQVREIVEVTEDVVETQARAIENVLDVDPRDLKKAGSAWQSFVNRYAGEFIESGGPRGQDKIRLRTMLTMLKSTSGEWLPEIAKYGQIAWSKAGRDVGRYESAVIEWDAPGGGTETMRVKDAIRRYENTG